MEFLRLILLVIFPVVQSGGIPFCYDESTCGPETWPGPCSKGTHQSPINMPSSGVKEGSKQVDMKFNSEYKRPHKNYFSQNNGHTIQVSLNAKLSSKAKITGFGMDGQYIFAQMHFHWGKEDSSGSEHRFNNKSYSMEVHLVHYSNAYPSFQAAAASSGDPKALAVIGVFLQAKSGEFVHKGLQGIIKTMSKKYQKAPVPVKGSLTLSDFLPKSNIGKSRSFFRYQGSLTTPPCTEQVLWTVFKHPLVIAPSQVEAFRKVKGHGRRAPVKNNVRPVKPLNDRILSELSEAKRK